MGDGDQGGLLDSLESTFMGHGGKRPGAGRKPTQKLTKEVGRELLRAQVLAELGPMVAAQIANAKGISHFFLRDQSGRFVQITDPKQIETALNSGDRDSYYWIHTKDPSVQAFTDLANRALDKPKEQEQEIKLSGSVDVVAVLRRRFERAKQAQHG